MSEGVGCQLCEAPPDLGDGNMFLARMFLNRPESLLKQMRIFDHGFQLTEQKTEDIELESDSCPSTYQVAKSLFANLSTDASLDMSSESGSELIPGPAGVELHEKSETKRENRAAIVRDWS